MAYLIDSDVFIQAKNLHYGFDSARRSGSGSSLRRSRARWALGLRPLVRDNLWEFVITAGTAALAAVLEEERTQVVGPRYASDASDSRGREAMALETNSIERAIAEARFFAPRLAPEVVAMRYRMVNRFFAAHEGPMDAPPKVFAEQLTVRDIV